MNDTVKAFPAWKNNATAAERLDELAGIAREKPERFDKFVIVYRELTPAGRWKIRTLRFPDDFDVGGALGLLEFGKVDMIEGSNK